jgi:hypothetical protein
MRIHICQLDSDQFERRDPAREIVDAAIIFEIAVVDDNNALAERGDIRHVMAGQ